MFILSSKLFFDKPKGTIGNNSDKTTFSIQTFRDVENNCRDFSGFDMSSEEFKNLGRDAWEIEAKPFFDRSENKSKDTYSSLTKTKRKTFIEAIRETNVFHSFKRKRRFLLKITRYQKHVKKKQS